MWQPLSLGFPQLLVFFSTEASLTPSVNLYILVNHSDFT